MRQDFAPPLSVDTGDILTKPIRPATCWQPSTGSSKLIHRPNPQEVRMEEARQALESLMEVIATLGRLPDPTEFDGSQIVIERYGSLKRAFAAIKRITNAESWEAIAQRRREDMLVYLALSRFRKRPLLSHLPLGLQRDMKAFFGTYSRACVEADELLFKAGDSASVDDACKRTTIGKLLPDDLYVHRDALDSLEPLLRIYEGCGRTYLGEVEGANIIKIHRRSESSHTSYIRNSRVIPIRHCFDA